MRTCHHCADLVSILFQGCKGWKWSVETAALILATCSMMVPSPQGYVTASTPVPWTLKNTQLYSVAGTCAWSPAHDCVASQVAVCFVAFRLLCLCNEINEIWICGLEDLQSLQSTIPTTHLFYVMLWLFCLSHGRSGDFFFYPRKAFWKSSFVLQWMLRLCGLLREYLAAMLFWFEHTDSLIILASIGRQHLGYPAPSLALGSWEAQRWDCVCPLPPPTPVSQLHTHPHCCWRLLRLLLITRYLTKGQSHLKGVFYRHSTATHCLTPSWLVVRMPPVGPQKLIDWETQFIHGCKPLVLEFFHCRPAVDLWVGGAGPDELEGEKKCICTWSSWSGSGLEVRAFEIFCFFCVWLVVLSFGLILLLR